MSSDADAIEWVAVNLQGQVNAGGGSAPCQVVTLHPSGVVLLPQMRGSGGMSLEVELQPARWPEPVALPGTLVREGEYHGHYAWQVQFFHVTEQAAAAVMELMGLAPPSDGSQFADHSEVMPAEEAQPQQNKSRRSYSGVFDDLPDMDVKDVDEARMDDDQLIGRKEKRDLFESVDQESVKKIYKEALRELGEANKKDKKKKGWFR